MGVILGIISGTIVGVRKGYTRTIAHMVVGDLLLAGPLLLENIQYGKNSESK